MKVFVGMLEIDLKKWPPSADQVLKRSSGGTCKKKNHACSYPAPSHKNIEHSIICLQPYFIMPQIATSFADNNFILDWPFLTSVFFLTIFNFVI